jgi:hypothetical protein
MTETEWLACNNPNDMVRFLWDSGKLSERKARLFAVACCLSCFWYRLLDDPLKIATGVAARHAEGLAEAQEVIEAEAAARAVAETLKQKDDEDRADFSARRSEFLAYDSDAAAVATLALNAPRSAASTSTYVASDHPERQIQVNLLRDLFGPLPFRPVTLSPSVRTWNSGTVVLLAEAIYQERLLPSNSDTLEWFLRRREQTIYPWRQLPSGYFDSHRLAVLADALEEADCTDQETLGHCRLPGEHVRGCWALDLILGKE